VQRGNYRELPALVQLAHRIGARQISFLPVDVANAAAFGRQQDFASDLALQSADLPLFEQLLSRLEGECADDFRSGFIAESPHKLRRILQYFAAGCGYGDYPPVRCNAPEFSAVIDARGRVQPCFFIHGPPSARSEDALPEVLNAPGMAQLRHQIRQRQRPECRTCVCSMWRDPAGFADMSIVSTPSPAI
jgi:radical SAM protein with 4Fe4S-binding SPASM domain